MSAAAEIARALGGGDGGARNGWHRSTCPVCQGENKLGIKDTEDGTAVHCFRLCRRADIVAALGKFGLFLGGPSDPPDPAEIERRRAKEEARRRQLVAEARDFLSQCLPWNATGQIARYFSGRGIDPGLLSPSIMWHGLARHPEGGDRPLLVGVIEHVTLGVIGATRTFLAVDGSSKATFRKPRLFLGLCGGGAVRFGAVNPKIELVIAEGIETVLSYMQLRGLPAGWAALSATGIKNLALPPEARRIVIAADNDRSETGWRAAVAAASRWTIFEGRRVRIDMPQTPGFDWNRVLISQGVRRAA